MLGILLLAGRHVSVLLAIVVATTGRITVALCAVIRLGLLLCLLKLPIGDSDARRRDVATHDTQI